MRIDRYLELSPLFAIYNTAEKILRPLETQLKQDDLTFIQSLILTALYFEDKPSSPTILANTFNTSLSNISHSLKHLESSGWLERKANPKDQRRKLIFLKSTGKKKVTKLIKLYNELQDHFESKVSERNLLAWNNRANELVKVFSE